MMDLFNDLAREAHDSQTIDGRMNPRDVAMRFVSDLQAQQGSGRPEVEAFIDRLLVDGAAKWLNDYRRRSCIPVKTKKGTEVEIPAYAGVTDESGTAVQMHLFDMTLVELEQHLSKLRKQRDTTSRHIQFVADLAAAMTSDQSLRTAGDAVRKLGLAA